MTRTLAALGALLLAGTPQLQAQSGTMSFFLTSAGPGKGADLGGLDGADAYCTQLAASARASGLTWRAYLSAKAANGTPTVNAKDRIGSGPWFNQAGVRIARNVAELHGDSGNVNKRTVLPKKATR